MISQSIKKYLIDLDHLGIKYAVIEHPSFKEVFEVLDYCNLTYADGASTMVLKADDEYIAVLRRDDTKINFSKLKNYLNVDNLRIASGEEFTKITGLLPGSARPYLQGLKTIIDKKILEREFVQAGSGSYEVSIRYITRDLTKLPNSSIADVSEIVGKKRILTGDTPTGKLHLGHYVGTLENRVKLQHEYETYILLANVHAFDNFYYDPERINKDVYNVFLDNLAAGIDPNVATIYLESGIPETYELYSLFLAMVKHSVVIRNPSIKEEIKYKKLDPSTGFVVYPILQAADILGFNADLVPVGEDQLPIIEQTREIARTFNKTFGETFTLPQAKVGRVARLIGTDGQSKMSKSGYNAILLSDDKPTLKQKVMACYTDPHRIHASDPGQVEGNPVFAYHRAFNPNKAEVLDLEMRYRVGRVGDVEVKEKLFIALNTFLTPIREKRKYYENRPKLAKEILIEGTKRARKIVQATLEQVRAKTQINQLIN